jgi:hypothetical protein
MQKRIIIAILAYILLLLIQTRIDYYFNHDLYAKGLVFSEVWYQPYSNLYLFLTLFYVLIASLIAKSYKFLAIALTFALTSGQDLIYFGVWNKGVYPNGQWTWMYWFHVFGFWNTYSQITFTTISVLIVVIICHLIKSLN